MTCKLCDEREANKKNTHYLSDGIIRSCLNLDGQDGNRNRAKGFYFDLSNDTAFIEFNFQQNTSVPKLEEALGRNPTEEEIERAKQIPFSVDYIFCSQCEDIFTNIENNFTNDILSKFRNSDLTDLNEIAITEIKTLRLFFYIQIWRTYICEDIYQIPENIAERLRLIILNNGENEEIEKLPLSITYLETKGDQKEYTSNYVGFTDDINPNLIFMNDFVIQFYANNVNLDFFDFYGLNETENYLAFINVEEEEEFKVKIIDNDCRKKLLFKVINSELVKQTISFYKDSFSKLWFYVFGGYPTTFTIQEYLKTIIGDDEFNILKYTRENVVEITRNFVMNKLK